jgi:hypothetical protein
MPLGLQKFKAPTHRPPLPRSLYSWYISVRGWVDPMIILRPERLCHREIQWTQRASNRDLPVCSAVTQPTAPPRIMLQGLFQNFSPPLPPPPSHYPPQFILTMDIACTFFMPFIAPDPNCQVQTLSVYFLRHSSHKTKWKSLTSARDADP